MGCAVCEDVVGARRGHLFAYEVWARSREGEGSNSARGTVISCADP